MSLSQACLPNVADPTLTLSKNEPFLSNYRDDGLWESIETDDIHTSITRQSVHRAPTDSNVERAHVSRTSVGVQTSPQPLPTSIDLTTNHPSEITAAGTTAKPIGTVDSKALCAKSQRVSSGSQETVIDGPIIPDATRRRRGRPRKTSTGFRNPRRSVRFSNPLSLEYEEPNLSLSRDSHVFVRLLHVVVQQPERLVIGAKETRTAQRRQEYSWNNRGKGWRISDRRSDEGLFQIVSLFDSLFDGGVDIFPVVLPTERGGVRQPLSMAWNKERACFLGTSQDGEILSVTLGEMKDMARDPWARQFVGYIM